MVPGLGARHPDLCPGLFKRRPSCGSQRSPAGIWSLRRCWNVAHIIHGDDVGNRDTVDAPLWYGVVAEEYAALVSDDIYACELGDGRSVEQVLGNIATGYLDGAANGVAVDPASALVWSPSHFTSMDTNYPAGTLRKGCPLEIQALWILPAAPIGSTSGAGITAWVMGRTAERAAASFDRHFWLPEQGWWADCLIAEKGVGAREAVRDTALRLHAVLPPSPSVSAPASTHDPPPWRWPRNSLYRVPCAVWPPCRCIRETPCDPEGKSLNVTHATLTKAITKGKKHRQRKPAYHNGTGWTTSPVSAKPWSRPGQKTAK